MSKDITPLEGKRGKQLSDMQLRELLRPHVPETIQKLIKLRESRNDNVALGATKEILNKFLPNMTAQDITTAGDKIQLNVVHIPAKRPLDTPPKTD